MKQHLETLGTKIITRNNIILKLAGYRWGADINSQRIASLGLVFVAAVWINSKHVSIVDVQLAKALRTILGTLKTTLFPCFPVMANITPSSLRREKTLRRKYLKSTDLPIYEVIMNLPSIRLKSSNPSWKIMDDLGCGKVDH